MHLVDIAYNQLHATADKIDIKLVHRRIFSRDKVVWEATTASIITGTDSLADRLPEPQDLTFTTHKPPHSKGEIEKEQWQVAVEVKRFEEGYIDDRHPRKMNKRWRRDAEDSTSILRAAEFVLFRLLKASEVAEEGGTAV